MTAPRHRAAIVACARWERACIAEWLDYHREIGFDHVYLYCNDDLPDALYAVVRPFGKFVTFHHYEALGQQKRMYLHYLHHYRHEAEWFMFLDVDEFLRLPRHRTIGAFLDHAGAEADGIYFNWSMFGNNGYEARPEGSVLLNYTRRAPGIPNGCTKVITRADAIDPARIGLGPQSDFWHYWDSYEDFGALRLVNVLGADVHDYNTNVESWASILARPEICERIYETAIINHYPYKALSDFARREARGIAGDFIGQAGQTRFFENGEGAAFLASMNAVEDVYLRDLWAEVLAAGRRLGVLSPHGLKNLSHGRPAAQSSIYEDTGNLAGEAVNGRIDGSRKFHTALEDHPWWQVDLGEIHEIAQVRVHNTTDHTFGRCRNLALAASLDGAVWSMLAVKQDGLAVRDPFIWHAPAGVRARFVRVTLLARDFLHLDQVEVFGQTHALPAARNI